MTDMPVDSQILKQVIQLLKSVAEGRYLNPHSNDLEDQFRPETLANLINAKKLLFSVPIVAQTWSEDDLWFHLMDTVQSLPQVSDPSFEKEMERLVKELIQNSPTLVALPLAHVKWDSTPVTIANLVIGQFSPEWLKLIDDAAKGKPIDKYVANKNWLKPTENKKIVAIAGWSDKNRSLAEEELADKFELLIGLALLFGSIIWRKFGVEHEKKLSFGGDSHQKPGVRGVIIDQGALVKAAGKDPLFKDELTASESYKRPFPLDELIGNKKSLFYPNGLIGNKSKVEIIEDILQTNTDVSRRFKIAAKWYYTAYWSTDRAEIALALGIAFEALLGPESNSVSQIIAERFALLEPKKEKRAERYNRFKEYYRERSNIAHGRETKKEKDGKNDSTTRIFDMAHSLQETARTLYPLLAEAKTNAEHASLFNDLKWGLR